MLQAVKESHHSEPVTKGKPHGISLIQRYSHTLAASGQGRPEQVHAGYLQSQLVQVGKHCAVSTPYFKDSDIPHVRDASDQPFPDRSVTGEKPEMSSLDSIPKREGFSRIRRRPFSPAGQRVQGTNGWIGIHSPTTGREFGNR